MEIKFKSLEELYRRIYPALQSKKKELVRNGYNYIFEEDIWNYLKAYVWKSSKDLDLGSMVNDIFSTQGRDIEEFIKLEFRNIPRKINSEEI